MTIEPSSPRVLILGNIANNGFLNGQILRQAGIQALVWAGDDPYIMSHPTWELGDFEVNSDSNHFALDYAGLGIEPAKFPWFFSGPMDLATQYFISLFEGKTEDAFNLFCASDFLMRERHRHEDWSSYINDILYSGDKPRSQFLEQCGNSYLEKFPGSNLEHEISALCHSLGSKNKETYGLTFSADWSDLYFERSVPDLQFWSHKYLSSFPRESCKLDFVSAAESYDQINFGDLAQMDLNFWSGFPDRWRKIFENCVAIIATATYGAIPMLNGVTNYTCYEHGTIRDLPFLGDGQARLLLLTYSEAAHIFSTNADVYEQALYLCSGRSDKITRLPHAFDERVSLGFQVKDEPFYSKARLGKLFKRNPNGIESVTENRKIFAPARHDWSDKGNDIILQAIKKFQSIGANFELVFVKWGRDVERSKAFLEEHKIAEKVRWIEPCSKLKLRKHIAESFVVLDQFNWSAFGTVTLEALSIGVPVITRINEQHMLDYFGEIPPVLNASESSEIASILKSIIEDESYRNEVGRASMRWIQKYHSANRFLELQLPVLESLWSE